MKIIKRNGEEATFRVANIKEAIGKANQRVKIDLRFTSEEIAAIADKIKKTVENETHAVNVEDIQDFVETEIWNAGKKDVYNEYHTYRYARALNRQKNTTDDRIMALLENKNEEIQQENANKNPTIVSTMRDYMAGEVSKDISARYLIPADILKAHTDGIIHFHDMDYFAMPIYNCCLINLEDMLQNGTVISGTKIDKPHSFSTACNVATQIIAQVASSQYGGQTITASHLSPFVDVSRKNIEKEVRAEVKENEVTLTDDQIKNIVSRRLKKEIKDGIQTLQYQILTLMTTNGQTPFVSVCLYLNEAKDDSAKEDLAMVIEEILRQRTRGVKNAVGAWVTNPFPKLLYVLEEDNVTEDGKYWYLTKLAAECTAKRMVPDYISEKKMMEIKEGDCFPCMGCRSFLNVYHEGGKKRGKTKYYGRFNQGVVTINLPDAALEAKGDIEKFWYILDSRLELCHRALRLRHEHLRKVKSDVAPILWQHGAMARLEPGEGIEKLLYGGYSSISLGYVGLYETVKALTGKNHWEEGEGKDLGLEIMKRLNDKCKDWGDVEHIGYSVYGTPEESTTYKFAKALQKRFGIIKGITDKNYVTNSYHVPVFQEIDAFNKIAAESPFQELSPGGAISYVELPNMTKNVDALLSVIKYFYDNIMYAEVNGKSDYCMCCGYDGEIEMVEDDGKLIWECPNCHNKDLSKMSVVRRVCGYLSNANNMNQGRLGDIHDRVEHLNLENN